MPSPDTPTADVNVARRRLDIRNRRIVAVILPPLVTGAVVWGGSATR